MVVRSPCDWADAMYRKPYHMCPFGQNPESSCTHMVKHYGLLERAKISRAQLFNATWSEWPPHDFNRIHQSHPYTYDSVFALRRHKLRIMQQIMDRRPQRVFVA